METTEEYEAPKIQVIFSFLEYLNELKDAGKLSEDAVESIEVATQCLSSAFSVDINNADQQKKYSIKPHKLSTVLGIGLAGKDKFSKLLDQLQKNQPKGDPNDIETKFHQYLLALKKKGFFNGVQHGTPEYEQRFLRAREKFNDRYTSPTTNTTSSQETTPMETETPSTPTPSLSSQERHEIAEKYKLEGNQRLAEKQYAKAAECYSKAIEMNPDNAIYYANRAAAYSHMGQHDKAISDCKISIQKKPDYSKAYGRLGLAYFSLGKYKEACDAYKKGLELEPTSQSLKESLAAAENKLREADPSYRSTSSGPSSPSTQSSHSAQPTQPTQSNPGGGVPNIADMLNNPQLANMMGNMFGGGQQEGRGGLNINELLSNPMIQQVAEQMMTNPAFMNAAQNLVRDPNQLNQMLNAFGLNGENPNQQ